MNPPLAHLLAWIEDEFRDVEGVRIRPVFPSTTQKSPDLEQDYDEESASLHKRSGVRVQTKTREYYFPEEWMSLAQRPEITRQIDEIRAALQLS